MIYTNYLKHQTADKNRQISYIILSITNPLLHYFLVTTDDKFLRMLLVYLQPITILVAAHRSSVLFQS